MWRFAYERKKERKKNYSQKIIKQKGAIIIIIIIIKIQDQLRPWSNFASDCSLLHVHCCQTTMTRDE